MCSRMGPGPFIRSTVETEDEYSQVGGEFLPVITKERVILVVGKETGQMGPCVDSFPVL